MNNKERGADYQLEMASCCRLLKQVVQDVGNGPFLELDITWASDNYYIPGGSLGELTKALEILRVKTGKDTFTLLREMLAAPQNG